MTEQEILKLAKNAGFAFQGKGHTQYARPLEYSEQCFYRFAGLLSGWISAVERLPDEPGIYLIMMHYQNDLGTIWTMDMASFGDGVWHKAYNVTHWRELPAPPTAEREIDAAPKEPK